MSRSLMVDTSATISLSGNQSSKLMLPPFSVEDKSGGTFRGHHRRIAASTVLPTPAFAVKEKLDVLGGDSWADNWDASYLGQNAAFGGCGGGGGGFFHQLGEFLFAGHGFSSWGFRFYFFGLIRLLQTFGMAG